MGATVLIHEASFAHDKAREARRKFHSTTEDAIEAGSSDLFGCPAGSEGRELTDVVVQG
jgi:hypothetical protein